MKRYALIAGALVSALFVAHVSAIKVEGKTWTLSEEEELRCANEGGCALLTRKFFFEEAAKMAEEMARKEQSKCAPGAWKDRT
jgi:hypothetical protein